RVMGQVGVGLYMMALPTLFLVLTLTQIGLPTAISKRVAEATTKGQKHKVKQILIVSLTITGCTSIFITIGLVSLIPWISTNLYTDQRVLFPLYAISPVIPIIAISSVLKGYFQGKQNMKPQSYALIIEQVIRICFVALFIKWLMPFGVEYAAAGAMFSIILGELISLLYMIFLFKRNKTFRVRRQFFSYLTASKQTIKELFSIALPNTGSKLINSITQFLEPILVAQSLAIAGMTTTAATMAYGQLTGYVLPLLFLPTFITHSLSIALVPAISESEAMQQQTFIHHRIQQAIRISFASGALATIVFTIFRDPILLFMYGSSDASELLLLMAPFYLFLYIQAPLQSALLSLDLAKPAMFNSLFGAVIKLSLLYFLATMPNLAIVDVAISMCVSVILVTFLHLHALRQIIRFKIPFKELIKMIGLLIVTYGVSSCFYHFYQVTSQGIILFLITLSLLALVYLVIVLLMRF